VAKNEKLGVLAACSKRAAAAAEMNCMHGTPQHVPCRAVQQVSIRKRAAAAAMCYKSVRTVTIVLIPSAGAVPISNIIGQIHNFKALLCDVTRVMFTCYFH
jgi:hypothetical protein